MQVQTEEEEIQALKDEVIARTNVIFTATNKLPLTIELRMTDPAFSLDALTARQLGRLCEELSEEVALIAGGRP